MLSATFYVWGYERCPLFIHLATNLFKYLLRIKHGARNLGQVPSYKELIEPI